MRAIASLGRELGIRILAEGIETRAERDFLAACDISLMQGYWFSKPIFQALGTIPSEAWE